MSQLLSIKDLHVTFPTDDGDVQAVSGVSFDLNAGETVAIVGESGSGKTVTSLSVLGLHNQKRTHLSGEINISTDSGVKNVVALSEKELRLLRGKDVAMIFQDPMSSLHPFYRIGDQLTEAYLVHNPGKKKEAKLRALELLDRVGIPDPKKRIDEYPHQFSGGMRQRVMIAMALILSPELLIADEPTTALDVTIQQQILALVLEERRKRNMSMLWITHDLGVVANLVDKVIVMYAGRIVEIGSVERIFKEPQHPYTAGLLASLPKASDKNRTRLASIPGVPPKPWLVGESCAFAPRCSRVIEQCKVSKPELVSANGTSSACFNRVGA